MKHNDMFSKDNTGAIVLIAALFIMFASAFFIGAPAQAEQTTTTAKVETIEVVATRLK
jgi:hypothetical protein